MRNQIWKDVTEAKFTQIYTEMTCQHYKRLAKYIDVFTIIFSGSGTLMGLTFWNKGALLPVIACALTALTQSMKLISPKLFPSDKDSKKLNDLIAFYFNEYVELHKLWHEFDKDEINEKTARERYFKIIEKEKSILPVTNELLTDDNKRRKRRAEKATQLFFNSKTI